MPTRKARQPVKRLRRQGSNLHLQLARAIGEDILAGVYQPGALLPNEAEWGARFGASRTAVREAIKTLNGKGLLVSRPKIGSRVEPRNRWNMLDRDVLSWHAATMDQRSLLLSIQEVRRILEPGVAELAARKCKPAQLQTLREALQGMAAAGNAEAMVAPDVAFHLALLEASNNDLLAPFGMIIEQALQQMFDYTSRHNPRPMAVIPMHEAVVDAIAKGDGARARVAVSALLADTDDIIAEAPADMRRDKSRP